MAVSQVDLGNQALGHLMRGSLQTLDGGDPQAVQIKLNIQSAIEEVIEEYDWPYCRVVRLLVSVTLADPTLRGWTYAHAIPSDMVALWRVSNSRGADVEDWEMGMSDSLSEDTTYIFTDTSGLYLRYGSNRVSLSRFPPSVIELMALKLAGKMCMPLTKDRNLRKNLVDEYTLRLSAAKTKMANMEPEVIDIDFIPETIAVRSE